MTEKRIGHFIDGREVMSRSGAEFDDVNPWTQERWATVALGGREDVDAAITAARRAFDEGPWPTMGATERSRIIARLADLMAQHRDELALADVRDMGKPITQARHDVETGS